MPAGVRLEPDEVWNYSVRELTQSQFPFWSEVITMQQAVSSVAGNSDVQIDIRPPSGETWLILSNFYVDDDTTNTFIGVYRNKNGAVETLYWWKLGGSYNPKYAITHWNGIITNSRYLRVQCQNYNSSAVNFIRGYSGFKLGTKIAEFEDLENVKLKPFERKTQYKINSKFEGLEDIIYDVYDVKTDDYRQVIYYYKDKVVRKDKKTGYPVERISSYIDTKVLLDNLEKIRNGELELYETGYGEWLNKLKEERGIDLLNR